MITSPKTILLDASPLGILATPSAKPHVLACQSWLQAVLQVGHRVLIPEIADYEVRRELLRAGKSMGVVKLDQLQHHLTFLTINSSVMRLAAELWARARQQGYPTAPDLSLDADVILAAQALTLNDPAAVIATGNVAHLNRYVHAVDWTQFHP